MLDNHYQYINTLITQFQADKNPEALEDLANFFRPLLFTALKRCIAREPRMQQVKEDMKGELYLILADLISNYNPELSYFAYYLSTRIDYAILARYRRLYEVPSGIEEIKFTEMPSDWEAVCKEDLFGQVVETQAIQQALDQLTKKQKEAIQLYYFEEMTQAEAAAHLNIQQGSFCKRLHSAMKTLKEIFSGELF